MNDREERLKRFHTMAKGMRMHQEAGLAAASTYVEFADVTTAADEIARLEAENRRLIEALLEYGEHGIDCDWAEPGGMPCECGLSELLAALAQGEQPAGEG